MKEPNTWRHNARSRGSKNIPLVSGFLFQFSCTSVSASKCQLCVSAAYRATPDQFTMQEGRSGSVRRGPTWGGAERKSDRGDVFLPDPDPLCDCCCCWAARLDATWRRRDEEEVEEEDAEKPGRGAEKKREERGAVREGKQKTWKRIQ